MGHHYVVTEGPAGEGWQVRDGAYFYAIETQGGSELLAYHWHPRGRSPIVAPHLHVGADIQIGQRLLSKVHLPTGAIRLQDVIRLAITELDVEPLRDDWEQVLARTLEP